MSAPLMSAQELRANDHFGGAQLIPGHYYMSLSPGQAREYVWNNGNPDCLISNDETGQHYELRELVGAGNCRFEPIEPRDGDPNLRVHAIITPDNRVIGTLITRLVSPEDEPTTFMDRVNRVADKIAGFGPWFITGKWGQPVHELQIRVRASQLWKEA